MRDRSHDLGTPPSTHPPGAHLPVEDLSTRELLRDLVEHARMLAREEKAAVRLDLDEGRSRLSDDVAFARREIREEVGQAKRAGTSLGVGAVLMHAAIYFLLGALALGLRAVGLPLWAGVLIVGLLACAAGGILVKGGTTKLRRVHLTPQKTIERFKEEKRWMSDRFRALTSRIRASA